MQTFKIHKEHATKAPGPPLTFCPTARLQSVAWANASPDAVKLCVSGQERSVGESVPSSSSTTEPEHICNNHRLLTFGPETLKGNQRSASSAGWLERGTDKAHASSTSVWLGPYPASADGSPQGQKSGRVHFWIWGHRCLVYWVLPKGWGRCKNLSVGSHCQMTPSFRSWHR